MIKYSTILLFITGCLSNDCTLESAKEQLEGNNVNQAINCYISLASTKDSSQAYNALADYYWGQHIYDSCIKYYERIFLENKVPLYAIVNLGDAYYKKGESLKALNMFLIVQRRDSLYPTINYNLAVIYMQQFELYQRALEFAIKEYQIDTLNTENLNLMAQVYLNLDSTNKAIYYFSRSIKLLPHNYLTYFFRGAAYMVKDEKELAYRDFNTSFSLNPTYVDALRWRIMAGNQLKKVGVCEDIIKLRQISSELDDEVTEIEKKCR